MLVNRNLFANLYELYLQVKQAKQEEAIVYIYIYIFIKQTSQSNKSKIQMNNKDFDFPLNGPPIVGCCQMVGQYRVG